MDLFSDAARNLRVTNTLVIGATYGVFLTIGLAWATFLQNLTNTFISLEENQALNGFVYAIVTSTLCLIVIVLILQIEVAYDKASKKLYSRRSKVDTIFHPSKRKLSPKKLKEITGKKFTRKDVAHVRIKMKDEKITKSENKEKKEKKEKKETQV